ncbi:MAG: hypothetical protein JW942_04115 [Opitutales bacterium]|nr:hypothetical protein [Opitutales bacterium]
MASTSSTSSLDWNTILEYNLKNAFAIPTSEVEDTSSYKYKSIETDTYSQSLALLNGVTKKLETIQTNLQLMQNYALEGYQATVKDSDARAEAYAQLRSLSAGIDTVVRDFKMEDIPLFNGRSFELSYGSGSIGMNLDNLASSGEEGLGLAKEGDGAFATISYDYLALMKNSATDIAGLDISEANATSVDLSAPPYTGELEDGDYWIKVTYMGKESVVEIQNMDGSTIEKIEGVDLTGTGQVSVKSNVGVELSFEKTYFETALGGDKHDWETQGAQSLYANLHYERNVQHILDDGSGEELVDENSVSIANGKTSSKYPNGKYGVTGSISGSLAVTANTSPVYDGVTTMESGQYDLKIKYDGAKTSLWLYDNTGNLISTKRNVDLTGEDPVNVDMGTGVTIELDPENFSSAKRDYHVYLNYEAEDKLSEELDYDEYYNRIISALETIQEQLDVVEQAKSELESRYSIVQSALSISSYSTSSLSSLIAGGSTDASSLFGAINATGSDSTGNVLTASGNILGALQSAASSMQDVDPGILALYY